MATMVVCQLGENIGTEVSGKGKDYTRPVVILKKLSKYTFLVVPTSTKIKQGSWYVRFVHNKIEMVVCLNQIKIIDYRRLFNYVGVVDDKDKKDIKIGFDRLYK